VSNFAIELLRRWYQDGEQIYTKGRGAKVVGLSTCQRSEWIKSEKDSHLDKRGWRHDITDAGRAALANAKGDGG
jgi:hypothetical protein